jgi:hypothetical protein
MRSTETSREGEAPSEPSSSMTLTGRSGSAGASPSLPSRFYIDFPRTGLPHWLPDDYLTMGSVHGFFGSSHVLVKTSCVFNTISGPFHLILLIPGGSVRTFFVVAPIPWGGFCVRGYFRAPSSPTGRIRSSSSSSGFSAAQGIDEHLRDLGPDAASYPSHQPNLKKAAG